MHYFIESIFVGVYSLFIYVLLNKTIQNKLALLFVVGFCKHLFGFLLYFHTLYCNYGYACNKSTQYKQSIYSNIILVESLIEGIIYVFLGIILGLIVKNQYIIYFSIGCILHLISELLQLHQYFCTKRCVLV